MKRLLLFSYFALCVLVTINAQSAGFNSSYAVFSINGGADTYYCMPSNTSCGSNPALSAASLGSFAAGSTNLILKGAEHNVYKCGGADITATNLNYRIYLTSGTPGSFISTSIGFSSGSNNGCGGQDQQWKDLTKNINVLSGLAPGAYTIEIYSDAPSSLGTQFLSNSSANYKATFTVTNAGNVDVFSSGGTSTFASYSTLAAAITAINGGTVHTGTITAFVANGYAETAPAGGYSITATGTASNPITFRKSNATGANPVLTASASPTAGALNDAVIKIIGGDYITIDGFTLLENANTTTTAASNNMTEWGIALLYASTTNGCQNNTIQNCTITLNRIYQNTFGIYSNSRHSATTVTTAAEVTTAAGANSNNKIYSNTINNVNYAIVFNGSSTLAAMDTGNDIGGSSSSTGNTITNYVTSSATAISSYVNITSSNYAIFMNHQLNANVSYNSITSATSTLTNTLGGILQNYSVTTAVTTVTNSTFNNNTVSLSKSATSGSVVGINTQGIASTSTGSSLSLNNNQILNCSITGTSSSSAFTGVTNLSAVTTLNINNNTVRGLATTATSGSIAGISNTGAVTGSINIDNNKFGDATAGFVTTSAATSGAVIGVSNTGAASTATLSIQNNDIRGVTHSVAASSAHTYITVGTGTPLTETISNNTFTNLSVNTTGNVTFISNNFTRPANGVTNVNNNSIVTAFNKTGAGGTVQLYNSNSSSPTTASETNTGNNFSNITLTGATTFAGWVSTDGSTTSPFGPNKTVTNNTFNNIIGGTSGVTVLSVGYSNNGSTTNNVSGNTITNISGSGAITALNSAAGAQNFFSNTINSLSSSSTSASVIGISISGASTANIYNNPINTFSSASTTASIGAIGISISGGTAVNVYKNKIYDLSASAATAVTGIVSGIVMSAGTTVQVYNNILGDMRAASATSTDAVRALSVTSSTATTTYRIYNNTVYLAATAGGATCGIYHTASATATTAALDIRNNIIYNASSGTAGTNACLRRSAAATYGNFATTSNRNAFVGATILADNTTNYATLSTYQTAVGARDANSFVETTAAASFFQSTTGSNSTYLHLVGGITTQCESGASVITTPAITDDFDGDTRNVSTPDVGADEFTGISPTPSITLNSITPSTNQCTATARVISLNVTTPSGSITGVTITFNNGTLNSNVAMTNTSGNTWTYTIPAATPTNSVVTWSATATNSAALSFTYNGTSYQDDPNFGGSVTITAGANAICNGNTTTLMATTYAPGGSITLGAGASTSSTQPFSPFNGGYGGQKTQYLILASELSALGLNAGNITSLGYEISIAGGTYAGFSVEIGNTALTAMPATANIQGGLTLVKSPSSITPIVGINTITFDTPFNWDGTSNIIVSMVWSNANTSNTAATIKYDVTAYASSQSYRKDSETAANLLAFTGATGAGTFSYTSANLGRPKFIFTGVAPKAPTSYAWSDGTNSLGTTNPITVTVTSNTTYSVTATINGCNLTTTKAVTVNPLPTAPTATGSTQCGTKVPTASVADPNAFTTPTFKWYDAATSGNVLQSSTSTTYTSAISVTTTLYVSVINPTTGCESARTPVTITVTPPPTLTMTSGSTLCNGEIYALSVTSTTSNYDSYVWSATTNLYTDAAATVAYNGTGNPTTVYYKTITAGTETITLNSTNSSDGCQNTVSSALITLPASISASAVTSNFCLSGSTNVSVSTIPTGANVQWQSSTDNTNWTDISGANTLSVSTGTITTTTFYRLAVNKATTNANCLYSNTVTVTVNSPSIGTVNNGTRCSSGIVNLSVTGSSGIVSWYSAATGGSALATGTTYSPSITTTTTYYVEASTPGSVTGGARASTTSTSNTTPSTYGLVFDATSSFTLSSVDVYLASTTSGNVVVVLQNSAGTQLQTATIAVPAGSATTPVQYTLNLGWNIPVGTGYRLLAVSGPAMVRESSLGGFPYPLGSLGSVTNGYISGVSTTYYYFYNWKLNACVSSRIPVTATVTPPPTIAIANAARCQNDAPTALTVTSSNDPNYTYSWSPATGLSATTGATVNANPTVTTTYSITAVDNTTGINAGCNTTTSMILTINANPITPTMTPASATICNGGSQVLSVSSVPNATALTESFNSGSGSFTVSSTTSTGFEWTNKANTFNYNNGTSYTFSGATGNFMLVNSDAAGSGTTVTSSLTSPNFSTSGYTALNLLFKEHLNNTNDVAAVEISSDGTNWTILRNQTATDIGSNTAFTATTIAIPAGFLDKSSVAIRFRYSGTYDYWWAVDEVQVTGTPADVTYSWNNASSLSNAAISNPTATPSTTTTYTAVATNTAGCTASNTATVNVNPRPTAVTSGGGTVCAGLIRPTVTFTFTGTAPFTFTYNNGTSNTTINNHPTNVFELTDAPAGTYTVNALLDVNCLAENSDFTGSATVTVNPRPVTNAGADVTINCTNPSTTLTATGGATYIWSTGETTASITVSPTMNSIYTVTTTDANGCTDDDGDGVNVFTDLVLLTANAGADATVNCASPSASLTASGGVAYVWSTGEAMATVSVSPTITTTYTVTVTGANGCTATDNVEVVADFAAPMGSISPQSHTLNCYTPTAEFAASGGVSYLWSNGETSSLILVSIPANVQTTSDTYTVTVTGANGCTSTYSGTVNYDLALPNANAGADVTINCTTPSTLLTATGGTDYLWNTGEMTASLLVDPITITTYIVTVTGANGCTATDDVVVTADFTAPIADAGKDVTIDCANSSATLPAMGGVLYNWNIGSTYPSITVNPTVTTTYTVTVTGANGCTATDDVVVTADFVTPSANAGIDVTVNCTNLSTVLSASGGVSYAWNNGGTQGGTVSPTSTTTYTVTVTGANGCTATDEVVVTADKTAPSADAGMDVTVTCANPSTILAATGNGTYTWNNGATQGGSVSPYMTTTYTVTVTAANGCTTTDDVVVTADKGAPSINAGADVTVNCTTPSTVLTATGGVSYAWNNGASQGGTVSPTSTTVYTVTVTAANGCTATDNVVVTADKTAPNADAGQNITLTNLNPNGSLTASGGISYVWSNGQTTATISVNNTNDTVYSVTVTGANGCTATDNVTVFYTAGDVTPPIFTFVPANTTINCQNASSIADLTVAKNLVTVTDDFPGVTVINTQVSTKGSSATACNYYNYTVTNTWKATDASGNTATAVQVITVRDVTAPTIDAAPANVTVSQNTIPTAATLSAMDNCTMAGLVNIQMKADTTYPTKPKCISVYYDIKRTWTASDACGNTSTTAQVIHVEDQVLLSCPTNKTFVANVGCSRQIVSADLVSPTFSDVCDLSYLSHSIITGATTKSGSGTIAGSILNVGVYTITYTANYSAAVTCSFTVTIQDTIRPKLNLQPIVVVNACSFTDPDVVAAINAAKPNPSDNCQGVGVPTDTIMVSNADLSNSCKTKPVSTKYFKSRSIKYTVTDASGNRSTGTQIIYLRDNTAPLASCNNDVTVSIGNTNVTVPASTFNSTTSPSSDNCTDANALSFGACLNTTTTPCTNFATSLTFTKAMLGTATSTTRTFVLRVTDACGNTNTCQATVTLKKAGTLAANNNGDLLSDQSDANVAVEPNEISQTVTTHGEMKCFPNPFAEDLNIQYNLTEDIENVVLKVYDNQGRIVNKMEQGQSLAGFYSVRWNLSNLSAGMYHICLEMDGKCTNIQRVLMVK